jgi:hypothetical protein
LLFASRKWASQPHSKQGRFALQGSSGLPLQYVQLQPETHMIINEKNSTKNDLQNEENGNPHPIQCVHGFLQPCISDSRNLHCHPCAMTLLTVEGCPLEDQDNEELHHSFAVCQRYNSE